MQCSVEREPADGGKGTARSLSGSLVFGCGFWQNSNKKSCCDGTFVPCYCPLSVSVAHADLFYLTVIMSPGFLVLYTVTLLNPSSVFLKVLNIRLEGCG